MWKRFRPRFSLKTAFIAMTVTTVAAFIMMLPTTRARRFVALIESGRADDAEAMLPYSLSEYSKLRRTVRLSTRAQVQRLSPADFFSLQRRVVVSGPMQFEHPRRVVEDMLEVGDFVVTPMSFENGYRHFEPTPN